MTEMRDRAKGFESQFSRDLDVQFRVYNRRNRLLGQWAAGLMRLPAPDAAGYVRALVTPDLADPRRQEALYDRLYADLRRLGVDLSDHRLRREMETLLSVARRQILEEDEAAVPAGP